MRRLHTLVLAGLALVASMDGSAARIHGQMYCWALDSELPVGCDPEEEDEEARLRTRAVSARNEAAVRRFSWQAFPGPGRRAPAGAWRTGSRN